MTRSIVSVVTGIMIWGSISILSAVAQPPAAHRDGKLLQGEKWIPFDYPARADFYVSPQGNDNWTGTLPEPDSGKTDGPFRTIRRAQEAVRKLKEKVYLPKREAIEHLSSPGAIPYIGSPHPFGSGKDILVYVRDGIYPLTEPLVFEPGDGGERVETNLPTGAVEYRKLRDHYVTYAAFPGEKPVITGALPVSAWKKKGRLWTAGFNADTAAMLIVNGKSQTLARIPNTGYYTPSIVSPTANELHFHKGQLKNWSEISGNRLIMLLRWHTGINSIQQINEKEAVATLQSPQGGLTIVPPRYYIENIKALLDTAGEWFFDKKLKEISYIPGAEVKDPNQVFTGVASLSSLLTIQGSVSRPVRNLRFYGLTFEGTTSGSTAIRYANTTSCEIVDCTIRSCGGVGLSVMNGCYGTRILHNRFESIRNGAVTVKGPVNPSDGREITRETQVSYNQFSDCGGINISASYTLLTTISHNYITKTRGRFAIYVGGWANLEEAIDGGYLVEYNHLDNVLEDSDDAGAITTAGLTFNSVIRRNLVHHVHAGFFNENDGFWFDNLSNGWTAEENIFYNLSQGEWKLCAALPEDNVYRNNFTIEPPLHDPEMIIEGEPQFEEHDLKIEPASATASGAIPTGSIIRLTADVINKGSTGIAPVALYVDGKIKERKWFPVIKNNTRKIEFEVRLYNEGEHHLAIGSTPYQTVRVEGATPPLVFEHLQLSENRVLQGEKIKATVLIRNMTSVGQNEKAVLFLNDRELQSQTVQLKPNDSLRVSFEWEPGAGQHLVQIGNSAKLDLRVAKRKEINLAAIPVLQYGSPRAQPYKIDADIRSDRVQIAAGGSDFFHAEDSYAAAYVKGIKGDFVATVKVSRFGERTHQWFRAGLFVRNDMAQSFDVLPGSKGSMLVFTSPARAGIEYDEFGEGCMHKASSTNLPENQQTPIYLKLVRHGNRFSGYISVDGKNWIIERHTTDIPGIAEAIDLGLAAGSPDKQQYQVEFTDWKIEVADEKE